MPTLPLYHIPENPDGWHRVSAPGGYEWWQLEATDAVGSVHLTTDFFDGNPFDDAYLQAYTRFRHRPTRVLPPLPRDYPCARFELAEAGRTSLTHSDKSAPLHASEARLELSFGRTVVRMADDGTISLALQFRGLTGSGASGFFAELTFRPLDASRSEPRTIPGEEPSTTHFRLAGGAAYAVSGTLREAFKSRHERLIRLEGRGRYAHAFGTGPIGKTNIY